MANVDLGNLLVPFSRSSPARLEHQIPGPLKPGLHDRSNAKQPCITVTIFIDEASYIVIKKLKIWKYTIILTM